MFHVMLESVASRDESIGATGARERETRWVVSPGVRAGWNVGEAQLVLGLALPLGLTSSADDYAVLGYISYELPFGR